MKILLQKLTGIGRLGLLSPVFILLHGIPAQPTPFLLKMHLNFREICFITDNDVSTAKETEHPVSTCTIRQNKENMQFTSRIFPTRTPEGSPKMEHSFKKSEPWNILTSTRFTNNSKELVYSEYRPYWSFYWTRDTRYKT